MKTLKCVSKYPDNNTVAAELLVQLCYPLFILPSLLHTRDSRDIVKWCHDSLLHQFGGKPLCMHRRSANSHLHTRWHPCQLTILTESMECRRFISKPSYRRTIFLTKIPVHIKTNTITSIQMKLGG